MGSKEWNEAAEIVEARERQPEIEAAQIEEEARKLEAFLNGAEGKAAKRLLKATDKHIVLGGLPGSSGVVSYIMDGEGLTQITEGNGYGNKQPQFTPTEPEYTAKAFRNPEYGKRKTQDLVGHIRAELDKIASEIKKG